MLKKIKKTFLYDQSPLYNERLYDTMYKAIYNTLIKTLEFNLRDITFK